MKIKAKKRPAKYYFAGLLEFYFNINLL